MKFTTVKHMKPCPGCGSALYGSFLTLLEWTGKRWTTYRGPQAVSLPAVWKHTMNPECAYEERIA